MSMETASTTPSALNDGPLRKFSNLSYFSEYEGLSNTIWRYADFSCQDIQRIQLSLEENQESLKTQAQDSDSLQVFYAKVCEILKVAVHPSLQQQDVIPSKKENTSSKKMLQIRCYKVDMLSLLVLAFSSQFFPVECLKLTNNSFTETEAREIQKLILRLRPLILYFEWNSLPEFPNRKQYFISMLHQRLQFLIFRQDSLGDQIASELLDELSSEKYPSLKVLDLSTNHLTNQLQTKISQLLKKKKNMIFLGLSRNKFKGVQFLKMIIESTKPQKKADEDQKTENIEPLDISLTKNCFNDKVGEFLLNIEEKFVFLHLVGNTFSRRWVKILRSVDWIRI